MTEQNEEAGLPLEPLEETPAAEDGSEDSDASRMQTATADDVSKHADRLNINLPETQQGGAPPWVELPVGFTFPRGKQVLFIRFKSRWTEAPHKGKPCVDDEGEFEVDANGMPVLYRQCVCWPVNTGDKALALSRAQRDPNRAMDELSKQMVRVCDGHRVDWSVARPEGIEVFWNEIGEKCRNNLKMIFTKLHVMPSEDQRDFLENCIAIRSTAS